MKLTVKKIDALKRELAFEIPKDRVSLKMEEVYKDMSKVTKVKGFRQGKVPRHVLEAEHGALAREETIKKLIPEIYQEGIQREDLSPLDLPEIENVEYKNGMITFIAKIDIKPEIVLKKYKGLSVKRKSSQVTEEEINKTLDYFKKSQGKECKEGESEIDDKFAKGLGFPNLEAFKDSLRSQMEMDKDRQNRVDLENQIVYGLIKEAELNVPQSLVKKQMDHRIQEARQRLKSQGMAEEDIKKKEQELRQELKEAVVRDVKVYLIFDKICEIEGIHVHEGENMPQKIMEFLLQEAQWEE